MYSAIKIGGKKLYELARAGQEVARPARAITIHALELLSCAPPDFTLRVHCSKGTYVRTLCHDLGAALGTGGCMAALRRTAAGAYTAAQAVPLADILAHPAPESLLLPVDTLFAACPALTLTPAQEKCCRNGASFTLRFAPGRYRLYAESGEFLALGEVRDGRMEVLNFFWTLSPQLFCVHHVFILQMQAVSIFSGCFFRSASSLFTDSSVIRYRGARFIQG